MEVDDDTLSYICARLQNISLIVVRAKQLAEALTSAVRPVNLSEASLTARHTVTQRS